MNRIRGIATALFPAAEITGTNWEAEWTELQRSSFERVARVFFPSVAIGYAAHFFFYDLSLNLQPIEQWFAFRAAATAICLTVFALLYSPIHRSSWYKLPAALALALLCYSQARVTVHHDVSYFFCFVFVLAAVLVLRLAPLPSAVFAMTCLASQAPSLLEAGVTEQMALSGTVVTVVICIAIRTAYTSEVRNFVLTKENEESQKRVIELTQDFSDRLSSFIPKVIANRLSVAVGSNKKSLLDAAVQVLQPKKMEIACLFSDIRGFTQGSKSLDSFVSGSVVPEVRACSDAVENHGGIPRKIGDLVFAYFDSTHNPTNVISALLAGFEMSKLNEAMNATASAEQISRYILIATGEAIVGNIGGVDSSVEITALGSPVNFLSRLDDATKAERLASILTPGDLCICSNTHAQLAALLPDDITLEVLLPELGISIVDFPEVDRVYIVRPTEKNHSMLAAASDALEESVSDGYWSSLDKEPSQIA